MNAKATEAAIRAMIGCAYFTEFPLAFPLSRLAQANPGESVLDPFCGGGATLLAARRCGLPAWGMDTNPAAVAIAEAKLPAVPGDRLLRRAAGALQAASGPTAVPSGPFWKACYAATTLHELCVLRAYFRAARMDACNRVLRGVLLGLLHGPRGEGDLAALSTELPAAFSPLPKQAVHHWRDHRLKPPEWGVMECLRHRMERLGGDAPAAGRGHVFLEDVRNLPCRAPGRRFLWVITSPPYYGLHTFRSHQWLRNWFLGDPPRPPASRRPAHTPEQYMRFLAEAWRAIDQTCRPNAQIILRLGSVPGIVAPPPEALLVESLRRSRVSWRLTDRRPAADPPEPTPRRSPFPFPANRPFDEVEYTFTADAEQSCGNSDG